MDNSQQDLSQPQELSPEQREALNEEMERAIAFEEMVMTKGWKYITAYFQNKVQTIASQLLVNPDEPIANLERDRQQLVGIKELLGQIDSSLEFLSMEREKQREQEK